MALMLRVLITGKFYDPSSCLWLTLNRWHQDVKPENILVVMGDLDPNYQRHSFKIADFQLAHFKTIMEDDTGTVLTSKPGTHTYCTSTAVCSDDIDANIHAGAPESCDPTSLPTSHPHFVKRCMDIWSLGCILSEGAVWAVKGSAGVQKYRAARSEAIRRIPGHSVEDCFHDEKELLQAVTDQHEDLNSSYDGHDVVTGHVINKMVKKMLRRRPSTRLTAEQLTEDAEETISEAEANMERRMRFNHPSNRGLQRALPIQGQGTSSTFGGEDSHSVAVTHNSVLNEDDKFMSSPRGTTHQTDASIAGHPFTFGSLEQNEGPLDTDVNPTTPVRTRRITTLQSSRSPETISAVVSAPPTRDGAISVPAQSPPTEKRKTMPYCSVEEAQNWHNLRKNGNVKAQLPDHWLMKDLENRDHVSDIEEQNAV